MKKALFVLSFLLGSLAIFSQNQTSFGLATKYQAKAPTEDWGEWLEPTEPILVYFDLGFGFTAVENGYHDRFILKKETTVKTYVGEDKTVFTIKAIDQEGKSVTLEFVYFSSGNFALTIMYNDIHYSYWCDGEHGAPGYPYKYFNSQPPESTPSPKVPSGVDI